MRHSFTFAFAFFALVSLPSIARAADPVVASPPSPASSPASSAMSASPAEPAPPVADKVSGAAAKPKDAPPPPNHVYVSFSPVHLVFPVVELTVEARLHSRIGVAAIGGYGNVKAAGLSIPVWEAGGQFVAYPVGDFDHGMQLGAEVLYMGASAQKSDAGVTVTANAAGLSAGAFVGYKLATRVGFTFNVQGGVAHLSASGDAKATGTNATASASHAEWAPLLNANLGWSF